MKRTHCCGELRAAQAHQDVLLQGWVHRRRDHGGLIFIDLRDVTGLVQVLFSPEKKELFALAKDLRAEFVLEIQGQVRQRPSGTENPNLATGEVEIVAEKLTVLNRAETPPFEIEDQTNASEEVRLAYRYIDLRRPSMQKNLVLRHRVSQMVRAFLDERHFVEVETPILTKSTPEGARDYLVPSRLNFGKFYALPQSPQLFKQLLMVAGLDRYFQISRCFRDEDLRADRQPEFTQIDIELSFPDEEEIYRLTSGLFQAIFKEAESLIGKKLNVTFTQMTYAEVIRRFGTDSPDARFDMELQDLTELFRECNFKIFETVAKGGGSVLALNAPGGARLSDKQIDILRLRAQDGKPGAKDLTALKFEKETLLGSVTKHFKKEVLVQVAEKLGSREGDLVLMVADASIDVARRSLGRVRDKLKDRTYLPELLKGNEAKCAFVWVTEFPLFEKDEEGNLTSSHHPFTNLHPE
ncbi:MAG: aspartate--tRNA ligase, partial [Candidatus Omnitrophota bacterium]